MFCVKRKKKTSDSKGTIEGNQGNKMFFVKRVWSMVQLMKNKDVNWTGWKMAQGEKPA